MPGHLQASVVMDMTADFQPRLHCVEAPETVNGVLFWLQTTTALIKHDELLTIYVTCVCSAFVTSMTLSLLDLISICGLTIGTNSLKEVVICATHKLFQLSYRTLDNAKACKYHTEYLHPPSPSHTPASIPQNVLPFALLISESRSTIFAFCQNRP